MTVLKNYPFIGMMGYAAGENPLSYPEMCIRDRLISFLLLYASIRITCINIRNGAKMELNNLSGTIYADTYRSQRETNFERCV